MSFTAICPNCKFYTPAEEGQKFLSQKKGEYLTWFNVFRGLLPVCLFHILQQETLKVHISAIQMSALLQHQALKSIAHRAHCSWILSSHFQVKLTALETGEAQNLSGPEIVGGSIFANQIPGGSLCCQVVGLLVPQWSSAVCLLQNLKFNEVRSAASISF